MAEIVVDLYSEHDCVRCEEVVRCRDCEHYSEYDVSDVRHFFGGGVEVEPDGFCKGGEDV